MFRVEAAVEMERTCSTEAESGSFLLSKRAMHFSAMVR